MQIEFARRARQQPLMREVYRQHAVDGILGVACFALEDVAIRHKVSVVHAIWHCFACLSMAKLEPLLQHTTACSCQKPSRRVGHNVHAISSTSH